MSEGRVTRPKLSKKKSGTRVTRPSERIIERLPLNVRRRATIYYDAMPTYEYACAKCGHTFEKFQLISAKALTTCPQDVCPQKKWGKGKVKRTITGGAGLIFKGSGFYITDYRSEGYKQAAKKDAPPSSTPAKTESKPATPAPKPKADSK
jgi:putative FmdB family regulatory protein